MSARPAPPRGHAAAEPAVRARQPLEAVAGTRGPGGAQRLAARLYCRVASGTNTARMIATQSSV
jgi:hypothetical protein